MSEKELGVETRANAHKLSGRYTAEARREVVAAVMATGSIAQASQMTGVMERTIRIWKSKARWWDTEWQRLQRHADQRTTAKYAHLMAKTLQQLEDRVEHGDVQLDRRGDPVRVPVKARDLAGILSTLSVRQAEQRSLQVKEHASSTLDALRSQFQDFAKAYRDNGYVAPARTALPTVSKVVNSHSIEDQSADTL